MTLSLLLNHFSRSLWNYIINFSILNFKDFHNPLYLSVLLVVTHSGQVKPQQLFTFWTMK
jgi:hypothetical protein